MRGKLRADEWDILHRTSHGDHFVYRSGMVWSGFGLLRLNLTTATTRDASLTNYWGRRDAELDHVFWTSSPLGEDRSSEGESVWTRIGFDARSGSYFDIVNAPLTARVQYWELTFPQWFVWTSFALVPALWLGRRALYIRRMSRGLCPSCGYSLTGNTSGICPECGTAAAGKAEAKA